MNYGLLTAMPKRWITKIMSQTSCFYNRSNISWSNCFRQPRTKPMAEGLPQCLAYLSNFNTMCKPSMHMVVRYKRMDLSLLAKPTKGTGEENSLYI